MKRQTLWELQIGKEYYIEPKEKFATNSNMKHRGRFLGYAQHPSYPENIYVANFDQICRISGDTITRDTTHYIDRAWNFYEIEKTRIQDAFEQRCVITILRNKIGDPHFVW
jgi:hypothetical protein